MGAAPGYNGYDGPNIDEFVDYKTEYGQAVKKSKTNGDQMTGCCPFHDDKQASFSADLRTGRWTCFAGCGSGNFIDFTAKLNNTSNKDAYKQILQKYGKDDKDFKNKKEEYSKTYTLSQYVFEKGFDNNGIDKGVEWLQNNFGAFDTEFGREKRKCVALPYKDETGAAVKIRYRGPEGDNKWRWQSGKNGLRTPLYGEQFLTEYAEKKEYIILVEGESDTHTLTYMGFPVLGVAGAKNVASSWPKTDTILNFSKIYIHKESDHGGEEFVENVIKQLSEDMYSGEVYIWKCSDAGNYKDPSALYIGKCHKDGRKAQKVITKLLEKAEFVPDIHEYESPLKIPGMPVWATVPDKWTLYTSGLYSADGKDAEQRITSTPIIVTRRLRNITTGDMKFDVEYWLKDKWISGKYPASTVLESRSIVKLANYGMSVSSENSKQIVKFLQNFIDKHQDKIPIIDSTSTFGWKTDDAKFEKFLPWYGGSEEDNDAVVLDLDPSQEHLEKALTQSGTYADWKNGVSSLRRPDEGGTYEFRFMMAAAFAAPLLQILRQRTFVVYNWGDSRGGKSATLNAAMSVWGNPEKLMITFNTTQVALELTANTFCNLPIGIDERQAKGTGKYAQNDLEAIIYMLTSGQNKPRGEKSGGIRARLFWNTVAMANGEQPLSVDSTQTGVETRTISVTDRPILDENKASALYDVVKTNYGWAAKDYMGKLIRADKNKIRDYYQRIRDWLAESDSADSRIISHIQDVSVVMLADILAEHWVFNGQEDLGYILEKDWKESKAMAEKILRSQNSVYDSDVNKRADDYILNFCESNWNSFNDEESREVFGQYKTEVENGVSTSYYYINKNVFYNVIMKSGGFSPRKTLQYLAQHDRIETGWVGSKEKGHSTNFITKRLHNDPHKTQVIAYKVPPEYILKEPEDNQPETKNGTDADKKPAEPVRKKSQDDYVPRGYVEDDGSDDESPFADLPESYNKPEDKAENLENKDDPWYDGMDTDL